MQDVLALATWWLYLFLIGFASLPISWLIFRKFTDLGYGFSKTIGVVAISYFVLITSTAHLLPFQRNYLLVIFVLYSALSAFVFYKNKENILADIRKRLRILIFQEILFTAGLLLWATIRAYQPDINGLEKFMDFGFINSILRTKFLPPADIWYAGKPINYYWFGHLITAVITKLSGIPSAITYNLMLATILGLSLTGAFSIISTLVKNLNMKIGKRIAFAAGIISAVLLTFGGNFHTPIYALKEGIKNYWYPDATRFIGYNPETNDKTIHEFPIYSFVVSDLHPHLMNFPIVLLFIALLFRSHSFKKRKSLISKNLPLGFLLGIFFMTNTWDFGNYLLLTGVSFLLFNLKNKGFKFDAIFNTATKFILVFVLGLIVASPFIFNFESIAQGVAFVKARSPMWQLGVLWGFPAILTVLFALIIAKPKFKLKRSDLFVASLFITSWILILLPEIIYVKDIYIASHHRANTMFKLTYQAYVMFYLGSGYIAVRTLVSFKSLWKRLILLSLYMVLFASVLWYPYFAVNSYYRDLKEYKGLSGEKWLNNNYPDILNAIDWFRQNIPDQPTILEAPGDSYTEFNVISSYTGLPTVSGWFVHEWLWRGSADFPSKRVSDIVQIYTSEDVRLSKQLLDNYAVEYVIVGPFERQKYPNLNEAKFAQLGKIVFSSGNTKVYQLH